MDFATGDSKPISELKNSPLEVTTVRYTTAPLSPAPNKNHWSVSRSGAKVYLKYNGGEGPNRFLQVTVKIGGLPVVTDAHIV